MSLHKSILSVSVSACLVCGCNSGVFIEDFMPDVPEKVHLAYGTPVKITFMSDNWELKEVRPFGTGKICDFEGNETGRHLPFEKGELARVAFSDGFTMFHIDKRNGRELEIVVDENLRNEDSRIFLVVGNEYDSKEIEISLGMSPKYKIDSIRYVIDEEDMDDNSYVHDYGAEQVGGAIIDNRHSGDDVSFGFFPYDKSYRKVLWTTDNFSDILNMIYYFGEDYPEVEIPDYKDGKLVMAGTSAVFCRDGHYDAGLDRNFSFMVKIPPGKCQQIDVYNSLQEYYVRYTMHASVPETGKKLTIGGYIKCSNPYDYFFTRSDYEENAGE